MFLLRCAFWLSVVYAAILWSHGTLVWDTGAGAPTAGGRLDVETVVRTAATGARDLCARHPDACLADAARLTSLLSAADPDPSPISPKAEPVGEHDVPLPVPDPRRVRDAKLTRAP